jgi:hypothetical protein
MTEATTEKTETKTEDKGGGELGTVEERAQRMGWTAKEKFRGDPERWVDAATFVKNGEESLPILRERLRTLEKTNVDLGKSVQEFKKMSDTAYERAYSKAKKELEAEVKRAAKAGDEVGRCRRIDGARRPREGQGDARCRERRDRSGVRGVEGRKRRLVRGRRDAGGGGARRLPARQTHARGQAGQG